MHTCDKSRKILCFNKGEATLLDLLRMIRKTPPLNGSMDRSGSGSFYRVEKKGV